MQPEVMTRPKAGEDYVQKRAAEMMLPQIKAYLGPDVKHNSDRDLIEDLAKYIHPFNDGYETVREMERHGAWAGDKELVDIMDDASYVLSRAIQELTKQWVKCVHPAMPFVVGDAICTDYHDRKGQVATVTRIDGDVAKYGVRYPDQPETSCYVIEVERLTAAPAKETADAA